MPFAILNKLLRSIRPSAVKRKTSRMIWNHLTGGFF